ncbi:YceI family protein [Tunicatimonas pelagia]|uniref:YceI family protein n=1 Tax=Tunicatimonas pelagia TaxID=931531 RepID=UPI00266644C5|nr:YceI family protein [Tunicatimonas pelagia]WKN41570.1 YceI family protein [Tunicatimonas pelagia]
MNMTRISILSLFLGALLFSCQQKPGGTEAEVSEAQEVEEVSSAATDYSVNTDQSQVDWVGFKPTGRHNGTIGIEDGAISVLNGDVVGGSFTLNMNDINVEDLEGEYKDKLTNHLKSGDFFSVEEYPTATFEITGVESYSGEMAANDGDDKMKLVVNEEEVDEYSLADPTHSITGNLTMRGTSLSVTFPAKVSVTDGQVTANAKFNIDRTKWGVNFREENGYEARAKDELIYDTVNVGFDITASEGEPTAMAK